MNNTALEQQLPSRGRKHICVPFESEAHYQECVNDVGQYRQYLTKMVEQHPQVFRQAMDPGYTFHACYARANRGCSDGFHATRAAWRRLFPRLTLVLCFLHSILKMRERCRGALRRQVPDRAWRVYQATTKAQFSQRLRRVAEWARATLAGAVAEMVSKACRHRADFTPAYDCPQAARTTNAVDRLHNHLDRVLYTMRYCHGQRASARWAVRAWARNGIFIPMAPDCAMTNPRARRLSRLSMAFTITPIGYRTSCLLL